MYHKSGLDEWLATVRRQGFWNQSGPKLREGLAHLVGLIMRRVGGDLPPETSLSLM